MFKEIFDNVREKCPLIHNITNYVTVNDCANVVLACGASPIMADDKDEVSDIQTICGGLNINIGTLNSRTIESMLLAGKRANELGHPVVLDPVGAGASKLRTETANQLLKEVRFTVIRGNISEIKTLALGNGTTKGVEGKPGRGGSFCEGICWKDERGRCDYRCDRHCGGCGEGILHLQRSSRDVFHHGNRLSALGSDGGLCDSQPGTAA